VENTKVSDMVDPSPKTPGCEDAPSVTYWAYHSSGQKVAVAKYAGCKKFVKANATADDAAVEKILTDLNGLAVFL
jgi:hypothetical protein